MEYTINQLAKLVGVSTRTLRYYDEIDLLKPAKINSSGYRIYGNTEFERLQQILFYRELDVSLNKIKVILTDPSMQGPKTLKEHYQKLLKKKEKIDLLIPNVIKSIDMAEGGSAISDADEFESAQQKMIDDNDKQYGAEIREKYGNNSVDRAFKRIKDMTKEQDEALEKLSNDLDKAIKNAFENGDPSSKLAMKACDLHRQWLSFYWDEYTKEAHAGLAQFYVEDEKFKAYYDNIAIGCAEFFRDSILIYTKNE